MPEHHLQEYEMFYQEHPFGFWREVYRTAQVLNLLAMINRLPYYNAPELSDFMPFYQEKTDDEDDDGVADYLANR